LITDAEVAYAKNGALVAIETLRGAWADLSDDWKAYTGGWCLAYSLKLDKQLAMLGVKPDDDPADVRLERYLQKHYEQT
jgi:hypothetical protein